MQAPFQSASVGRHHPQKNPDNVKFIALDLGFTKGPLQARYAKNRSLA
ncbi:hypothetical protein [Rhodoferax saidenbachensis]|uniref:Uncharacterized protein n=1 Tax=Rhodoferax saidenbachensis TaxID=1484693 RepID=A0ABU1ZQ80_9BURK|nr:hypothetical protein [Rhodoferax saidenbachensis]MDR7307106.1 hypothetical protein [Rhodoferax saidenbachensis]